MSPMYLCGAYILILKESYMILHIGNQLTKKT